MGNSSRQAPLQVVEEKTSRKDILNIRVDRTVPAGISATKRICNENCIFDHATGARCNDDLFLNEQGPALSNEGFAKIIKDLASVSGKKVRVHIAGDGEPTLLNNELVEFVKMLKGMDIVTSVKLTTNGTMLSSGTPSLAQRLGEAGLDNINLSLHTLKPDTFKEITGIDALDIVLRGIDGAVASGIKTSINCVLRPETLDELGPFIELSKNRGVTIKFFSLLSRTESIQKEYDALIDKLKSSLAAAADEYSGYAYPYDGMVYRIGNAVIDVKDSRANRCPNVSCSYRSMCIEGCRYEARVSRTGILQPCGVRSDNKINLTKPVITRNEIAAALVSGGKL